MMRISKEIIDRIRTFKDSDYNSPTLMEEDFYSLTSHIWESISNNDDILNAKDLALFSEVEEFLLEKVIYIHNHEREKGELYRDTLHNAFLLNDIKECFSGDLSYHNIYFLNNDVCDYYFVGDIHSDSFILSVILDKIGLFNEIVEKKNSKIIFLGDYVDRGNNHFKTLEVLLLLKYLYPDRIFLLMGNHDIGKVEGDEVTLYLKQQEEENDYFYYFLRNVAKENSTFKSSLVTLYQDFMNNLNVIAYPMSKSVNLMGVHGGIPRPTDELIGDDYFEYLKSHAQFTDMSEDWEDIRIRDNIIWSDPSTGEIEPVIKKKRFKFFHEHFSSFRRKVGFDVLIRGHQAVKEGVVTHFNKALYTVFSTGQIIVEGKEINTETFYTNINPKILKYSWRKGLPLIDIDLNK